MTLLAVALSLLVGASLGLLGGGGSILTVPILVYVLGLSITPSSWSLGYAGGLEAQVVSTTRVSIALQATIQLLSEAQTAALIGGAVISADAISW